MLGHVTAIRYVAPMREGGSLPGLMEADDLGTYVVKFRAAGQGTRALVAEVVVAGLARALGLPVPRLVTIDVDGAFADAEPDEEIQDLLRKSAGVNLGVDYLPGALDFGARSTDVDPALAARVLWLDALVGNVDRSHRNPNMLWWGGDLVLIDHGATLAFHHRWSSASGYDARAYDTSDHALIAVRADVVEADADLAPRLTREVIVAAVADVPGEWLEPETVASGGEFADVDAVRTAYVERLAARLDARASWVPALAEAAGRGDLPVARPTSRPAWLSGDGLSADGLTGGDA